MKIRKFLFVFFLIAPLLILLLSLFTFQNLNMRVWPHSQGDAEWICEEPYIKMIVSSDDISLNEKYDPYCYLYINGEEKKCSMLFDYGGGLTITLDNEWITDGDIFYKKEAIIVGKCDYQYGSFSVNIESDTIYGGKYDTLNFVKIVELEPMR